MKKLFLTSIIFMTLFTVGFSQTTQAQMKTPQERAEHQTKRWTKILSLSPDQASQAKAVFLDRDTKIDAIKSKYASGTDKKTMHVEEKTVREQADAALKAIFTSDQYNTYIITKDQQKQQHGQK